MCLFATFLITQRYSKYSKVQYMNVGISCPLNQCTKWVLHYYICSLHFLAPRATAIMWPLFAYKQMHTHVHIHTLHRKNLRTLRVVAKFHHNHDESPLVLCQHRVLSTLTVPTIIAILTASSAVNLSRTWQAVCVFYIAPMHWGV